MPSGGTHSWHCYAEITDATYKFPCKPLPVMSHFFPWKKQWLTVTWAVIRSHQKGCKITQWLWNTAIPCTMQHTSSHRCLSDIDNLAKWIDSCIQVWWIILVCLSYFLNNPSSLPVMFQSSFFQNCLSSGQVLQLISFLLPPKCHVTKTPILKYTHNPSCGQPMT